MALKKPKSVGKKLKNITTNLRMYVNELAFCISYCKANGDVEMERIYQEAYEKKSAQLAMLNDLNKGNL